MSRQSLKMPDRIKKIIKKSQTGTSSKQSARNSQNDAIDESRTHAYKPHCIVCNKLSCKKIDKAGVKRIFSPFTSMGNSTSRSLPYKPKRPDTHSIYCAPGLSAKEKTYVISSCQNRSSRYIALKSMAANAIKQNKIFSICGSCSAVRKALLERGWVEKITANRMNLSKIRDGTLSNKVDIHGELERLLLSNLVEKYTPNFIWRSGDDWRDATIDMTKDYTTMINKLRIDALWTSKQGLCYSMKRNYWFYIEDVAEVNGPRTYNTYDTGEIDGFVKDFKITACTSLLKWILSMVANERPVFVESGQISMTVMVFALNRCKEYLFRKQNKDIDRNLSNISNGQWNAFLSKYYRIIARDEVFEEDSDRKLPLYLRYAKFLLKEMHKYRPQLSCEGCHNIWIIKPAHCSRGRGIRMASKLKVISNLLNKANTKYVIQKYIEEPLLIHQTKFDIRQYYLVTNTYPLEIWMYKDCYLKFSSQKYTLKNFHESIHLTNNAVQRKYMNCTGRHPELPEYNMWDLDTYKDYLNRIGKDKVWDNIIYPGMKKSIIGIMLSCQDSLSVSKNRFELYGCDFILDKEFKPWLIEINSCPDLKHTTIVTAKICPAVVSDIIKVVIDYAHNSKSATGKFECIYRQPITMPRYGLAGDLFIQGYSLPLDYFYRGKIELKESYDNADITSERDIKSMLNKLKRYCVSDIMVVPEDDVDSNKKKSEQICIPSSESENDIEAKIVSEQLEDLIDRIISNHASSSNNSTPKPDSSSCVAIKKSIYNSQNSLVKKSSQFMTASATNLKELFNFSKLEDASQEKLNLAEIRSIKSLFKQFSSTISLRNENNKNEVDKSNNEVLQATTNIISFIKRKEKEYLR